MTRALARGGGGRRKEITTGKFAGVGGLRWGEEGGRERPRRLPGCKEPLQRSNAKCSAAFLQPGLPTSNTFCAEVMP